MTSMLLGLFVYFFLSIFFGKFRYYIIEVFYLLYQTSKSCKKNIKVLPFLWYIKLSKLECDENHIMKVFF